MARKPRTRRELQAAFAARLATRPEPICVTANCECDRQHAALTPGRP